MPRDKQYSAPSGEGVLEQPPLLFGPFDPLTDPGIELTDAGELQRAAPEVLKGTAGERPATLCGPIRKRPSQRLERCSSRFRSQPKGQETHCLSEPPRRLDRQPLDPKQRSADDAITKVPFDALC